MDRNTQMLFSYRGLMVPIDRTKIELYQYYKAIPFNANEIDIYICCEYRKQYQDPLNNIAEIGTYAISDVIDRYLEREIKVAQYA